MPSTFPNSNPNQNPDDSQWLQPKGSTEYEAFRRRSLYCWLGSVLLVIIMSLLRVEQNQVAGVFRASMFLFCVWFGMTEVVFNWFTRLTWRYVLLTFVALWLIFAFRTQVGYLLALVALSFAFDRAMNPPSQRR